MWVQFLFAFWAPSNSGTKTCVGPIASTWTVWVFYFSFPSCFYFLYLLYKTLFLCIPFKHIDQNLLYWVYHTITLKCILWYDITQTAVELVKKKKRKIKPDLPKIRNLVMSASAGATCSSPTPVFFWYPAKVQTNKLIPCKTFRFSPPRYTLSFVPLSSSPFLPSIQSLCSCK